MLKRMNAMISSEDGQGMTEYIIIVALIAIGTIAVVTIFGNHIRALFGTSANALAGSDQKMDGTIANDELKERNLEDFTSGP